MKTNSATSAITDAKVLKVKAEKVIEAPENVGAARRACDVQLMRDQIPGTSSSGKKRTAAVWGIGSKK